jgi:hypothetical protein
VRQYTVELDRQNPTLHHIGFAAAARRGLLYRSCSRAGRIQDRANGSCQQGRRL